MLGVEENGMGENGFLKKNSEMALTQNALNHIKGSLAIFHAFSIHGVEIEKGLF